MDCILNSKERNEAIEKIMKLGHTKEVAEGFLNAHLKDTDALRAQDSAEIAINNKRLSEIANDVKPLGGTQNEGKARNSMMGVLQASGFTESQAKEVLGITDRNNVLGRNSPVTGVKNKITALIQQAKDNGQMQVLEVLNKMGLDNINSSNPFYADLLYMSSEQHKEHKKMLDVLKEANPNLVFNTTMVDRFNAAKMTRFNEWQKKTAVGNLKRSLLSESDKMMESIATKVSNVKKAVDTRIKYIESNWNGNAGNYSSRFHYLSDLFGEGFLTSKYEKYINNLTDPSNAVSSEQWAKNIGDADKARFIKEFGELYSDKLLFTSTVDPAKQRWDPNAENASNPIITHTGIEGKDWVKGEIPLENVQHDPAMYTAKLLDTLGKIEQLKSASDYNGFISEDMLKSVLPPELLDVKIVLAFARAKANYKDFKNTREVRKAGLVDASVRTWVSSLLGRPMSWQYAEDVMGWTESNQKLVGVHVSKEGKVTYETVEGEVHHTFDSPDLSTLIDTLQNYQDKGFKVLVDNSTIFETIHKNGTNTQKDKTKAVALRSIEVLTNISFKAEQNVGEASKSTSELIRKYQLAVTSKTNTLMPDGRHVDLSTPFSQVKDYGSMLGKHKASLSFRDLVPSYLLEGNSPFRVEDELYSSGYRLSTVEEIIAEHVLTAKIVEAGKGGMKTKEELMIESLVKEDSIRARAIFLSLEGNLKALESMWKQSFSENGYPIEANLIFPPGTRYRIPNPEEPTKYVAENKGGKFAYLKRVQDAISKGIQDLDPKVLEENLVKYGVRPRNPDESLVSYIQTVLPEAFANVIRTELGEELGRKYVDFSSFGDGNLGHIRASELGFAILHTIVGKREGVETLRDTRFNGEELANSSTVGRNRNDNPGAEQSDLLSEINPEKNEIENAGEHGSSMRTVEPSLEHVNFASPLTPEKIEKLYNDFKLQKRIQHILSRDFSPTEIKDFFDNGVTVGKLKEKISPEIMGSGVLLSPAVATRGQFDIVRSLEAAVENSIEIQKNVPENLWFINHDGIYTAEGLPLGIFEGDNLKNHWAPGDLAFLNPGFATGAIPPGGVIFGLAWSITHHGILNADAFKILLDTVSKGYTLIEKGAKEDKSGNIDQSAGGIKIILGMVASFNPATIPILKKAGIDIESKNGEIFIEGNQVKDPRHELLKTCIEGLEETRILPELLAKLKKLGLDKKLSKEFFKGIAVPRSHGAGEGAILKKLTRDHNPELPVELRFSLEELKEITKLATERIKGQKYNRVDKAIGLVDENGSKVKDALRNYLDNISPHIMRDLQWNNPKIPLEKLKDALDEMTERYSATLPEGKNKAEIVAKYRQEKEIDFRKRLKIMSEIEASRTPNDSDLVRIDKDRQIFKQAHGTDLQFDFAKRVRGQAQRNLTPFRLKNIDPNGREYFDSDILNLYKSHRLYFRNAKDEASGRSYPLVDPRINPNAQEAARVGYLYDIEPLGKNSEDLVQLYYKSLLMELAPNFLPPSYTPDSSESKKQFFGEWEDYSSRQNIHNVTHAPKSMTDQHNPRFFTSLPHSDSRGASLAGGFKLNPGVSGFMPQFHNFDFSQIGNPLLQSIITRQEFNRLKPNVLLERARANAKVSFSVKEGVNTFKPEERGHVTTLSRGDRVNVPSSKVDPLMPLIRGIRNEQEMNLIELRNMTDKFNLEHGTDLTPVEVYNTNKTSSIMNRALSRLTSANEINNSRVTLLDAFDAWIGREIRSLLKDSHTTDLNIDTAKSVNPDLISEWNQIPVEQRTYAAMLYLFGQGNRKLAPFIEFSNVGVEGVVHSGTGRMANESLQRDALAVFTVETAFFNNLLFSSNVTKEIIKDHFATQADHPGLKGNTDANGFPIDISRAILFLTESERASILLKVRQAVNEIAIETFERGLVLEVYEGGLESKQVQIREEFPNLVNEEGLVGPVFEKDGVVHHNTKVKGDVLFLPTRQTQKQILENIFNSKFIRGLEIAAETGKSPSEGKTVLDLMKKEAWNRREDTNEQTAKTNLMLEEVATRSNPSTEGFPPLRTDINGKSFLDGIENLNRVVNIELGSPRDVISVTQRDLPFYTPFLKAIQIGTRLHSPDIVESLRKNILLSSREMFDKTNKLGQDKGHTHTAVKIAAVHLKSGQSLDTAVRFLGLEMSAKDAEIAKQRAQVIIEAYKNIIGAPKDAYDSALHMTIALLETAKLDLVEVSAKIQEEFSSYDAGKADALVQRALNVFNGSRGNPVDTGFRFTDEWGNTVDTGKTVLTFSDPKTFATRFPGSEKLVGWMDKLSNDGHISPETRDRLLLMLGSLAEVNPTFLDGLSFEHSDSSSSWAQAGKKDNRYFVKFNIDALQRTPENEVLRKFAEELTHIAQHKYVKTNSAEWRRVEAIYRNNRTPEMVRELFMSMNNGKTYEGIEADVTYAMSSTVEFFGAIGSSVLLRETVYAKGALEGIRTKHGPLGQIINLYEKAFNNLVNIGQNLRTMSHRFLVDPQYNDLFKPLNDLSMSFLTMEARHKFDVNNSDFTANARLNRDIARSGVPVTMEQVENMRTLVNDLAAPGLMGAAKAQVEADIAAANVTLLNNRSVFDVLNTVQNLPRDANNVVILNELSPAQQGDLVAYFALRNQSGERLDTGMSRLVHQYVPEGVTNFGHQVLDSFAATESTTSSFNPIVYALANLLAQGVNTDTRSMSSSNNPAGINEMQRHFVPFLNNMHHVVASHQREHFHGRDPTAIEQARYDADLLRGIATNDPAYKPIIEATQAIHRVVLHQMNKGGTDLSPGEQDPIGVLQRRDSNESQKNDALPILRRLYQEKLTNLLAAGGRTAAIDIHALMHNFPSALEDTNSANGFKLGAIIDASRINNANPRLATTVDEAIAKEVHNRIVSQLNLRNQSLAILADPASYTQLFKQELTNLYRGSRLSEDRVSIDTIFNHLNVAERTILLNEYSTNISSMSIAGTHDSTQTKTKKMEGMRIQRGVGVSNEIHPLDLAVESLMSLTSNTFISAREGSQLTFSDIFHGATLSSTDQTTLSGVFSTNLQNISLNLTEKSGARGAERALINERLGNLGIYIDFPTLVAWTRNMAGNMETPNNSSQEHQRHVVSALDRLSDTYDSIRGNRDRDLGEPYSISRAIHKVFAVAKYIMQSSIPVATIVSEGVKSVLDVSGNRRNPFTFMKALMLEYGKAIKEKNLGRLIENPSNNPQGQRILPQNTKVRPLSDVARECATVLAGAMTDNSREVGTVNRPTPETGEHLSWFQRAALHRNSNTSNVSESLWKSLEISHKRLLTENFRNIITMRDAFNLAVRAGENPQDVITRLHASAGEMHINRSTVHTWLESGLFRPGILETLIDLNGRYPTRDGLLSVDSYFAELKATTATNHARYDALQEAWLVYNQASFNVSKLSGVRNHPLQVNSRNTVGEMMLSFWRSWMSQFVAQQAMKRATTSSLGEFVFNFAATATLDTAYTLLIMLASGMVDDKTLKKTMDGKNNRLFWDLAIRHPLFSGNSLGILVSLLDMASKGPAGGGITGVTGSIAFGKIESETTRGSGAVKWALSVIKGENPSAEDKKKATQILSDFFPVTSGTIQRLIIQYLNQSKPYSNRTEQNNILDTRQFAKNLGFEPFLRKDPDVSLALDQRNMDKYRQSLSFVANDKKERSSQLMAMHEKRKNSSSSLARKTMESNITTPTMVAQATEAPVASTGAPGAAQAATPGTTQAAAPGTTQAATPGTTQVAMGSSKGGMEQVTPESLSSAATSATKAPTGLT